MHFFFLGSYASSVSFSFPSKIHFGFDSDFDRNLAFFPTPFPPPCPSLFPFAYESTPTSVFVFHFDVRFHCCVKFRFRVYFNLICLSASITVSASKPLRFHFDFRFHSPSFFYYSHPTFVFTSVSAPISAFISTHKSIPLQVSTPSFRFLFRFIPVSTPTYTPISFSNWNG